MYGVNRITGTDDMMLISLSEADPIFMAKTLRALADAGVVVDMISQSAPLGGNIRFSFTAPHAFFEAALKAIGPEGKTPGPKPMISGGYAKIYLYGEEMVDSVGVASRALDALLEAGLEISLITTSDLDISLLLRQEDADIATDILNKAFSLS